MKLRWEKSKIALTDRVSVEERHRRDAERHGVPDREQPAARLLKAVHRALGLDPKAKRKLAPAAEGEGDSRATRASVMDADDIPAAATAGYAARAIEDVYVRRLSYSLERPV